MLSSLPTFIWILRLAYCETFFLSSVEFHFFDLHGFDCVVFQRRDVCVSCENSCYSIDTPCISTNEKGSGVYGFENLRRVVPENRWVFWTHRWTWLIRPEYESRYVKTKSWKWMVASFSNVWVCARKRRFVIMESKPFEPTTVLD